MRVARAMFRRLMALLKLCGIKITNFNHLFFKMEEIISIKTTFEMGGGKLY